VFTTRIILSENIHLWTLTVRKFCFQNKPHNLQFFQAVRNLHVALKILYVYDLSKYYASSKQKSYKNTKTKMFVTYGKGKLNTQNTWRRSSLRPSWRLTISCHFRTCYGRHGRHCRASPGLTDVQYILHTPYT
jgi:hypothetical protein